MKFLLFSLSLLAVLAGLLHFVAAKTAIHEVSGYVLFLIAAVLMSGAGIIEAVHKLRDTVRESAPRN